MLQAIRTAVHRSYARRSDRPLVVCRSSVINLVTCTRARSVSRTSRSPFDDTGVVMAGVVDLTPPDARCGGSGHTSWLGGSDPASWCHTRRSGPTTQLSIDLVVQGHQSVCQIWPPPVGVVDLIPPVSVVVLALPVGVMNLDPPADVVDLASPVGVVWLTSPHQLG